MLSLFASDTLSQSPVLIAPIIALLLFTATFTLVSIRALTTKKKDVERMAHLPFEGEDHDG